MRKTVFSSVAVVALALVLTFTIAGIQPAFAQGVPGAPSGDGIVPVYYPDNPNCVNIGHEFGFKLDGSPNGTFTLTSPPGTLEGGALPDALNSITINNSNGVYFDWSATLGIDAVIVKGGPNANVYFYNPEDSGDTLLHAPINPANGQPYGLSHITFCYEYELVVTKDAVTSFTRTYAWEISKVVTPDTWNLFTGDSGTSQYTVAVDRQDPIDSNWMVSGTIEVYNPSQFTAIVTGVTDELSGIGALTVDCGVTFPYELAAGATLECSYTSGVLPDGVTRTNTATATTTGDIAGGSGVAQADFANALIDEVNASISVTDTNGESWGPVSDDTQWSYPHTFTCDEHEGVYNNTATIVETGQTASASVTVNCYDLLVAKSADTTLDRSYDWTIEKQADAAELTLSAGQLYEVNYTVEVSAAATDDNWQVSGEITVTNNHPSSAAELTSVTDLVSPDIAASVDCPSLSVPAGGSIVCTYGPTALPDAGTRTNTATATLQNYAYASDGTSTASGTTSFTGSAAVDFAGATTTVIDECVNVSDTNVGALGTVCAADAPHSFTYTITFGQHPDADVELVCGDNTHVNTATFVTNDTGATGEDTWTVTADVVCEVGCTLTPGYWKTHSSYGPAPYDDTWAQIGEDTIFFLSGQSYYDVLWTPPKGGNAYYILAHAYIAAELNFLNGADPSAVQGAFDSATDLFETYTPEQVAALKGNTGKAVREQFITLAGTLDDYNNGELGPGHCDEDTSSTRFELALTAWELFLPSLTR